MRTNARPATAADPLAAVLRQLADCPDGLVRGWAKRLARGDAASAGKGRHRATTRDAAEFEKGMAFPDEHIKHAGQNRQR